MATIRLEYDSLLEDMVAAHLAQAGNLRTVRNARAYNATIYGVVFAALIAYFIRGAIPMSIAAALAVGVVLGGLLAAWVWFEGKHRYRRHLESVCAELRGTRGRVRNVIEMSPADIRMHWRGMTLACTWPSIAVVDDAPGHVEISGPGGMTMVIPARAFANDQAKAQFAAQARAWREAAGGHWVSVGHRNCPKCEYDLFGCESDSCPECGTSVDAPIGLRV